MKNNGGSRHYDNAKQIKFHGKQGRKRKSAHELMDEYEKVMREKKASD